MSAFHTGVLLADVIPFLNIKRSNKYIDATIGGGDYTEAILSKGGIVLGIDQDEEAISFCRGRFKEYIKDKRLSVALGNFENVHKIALENDFHDISGIVYDLGISSGQIDNLERGFSFKNGKAVLDMRMSKLTNVKASDILNALGEKQLAGIFYSYGNLLEAKLIARKIVEARKTSSINTVQDLIDILRLIRSDPYQDDFLAKVFLALRIVTNNELESLVDSLPRSIDLLTSGGRLAVISFQSIEDKIVKNLKRSFQIQEITKSPIVPDSLEILQNPRSRSAKLRVYEKI